MASAVSKAEREKVGRNSRDRCSAMEVVPTGRRHSPSANATANPQACPEAAAFRQGGQQSAEHLPDKDAQQSQCTRGRRHVADTIPQKKTAEAL